MKVYLPLAKVGCFENKNIVSLDLKCPSLASTQIVKCIQGFLILLSLCVYYYQYRLNPKLKYFCVFLYISMIVMMQNVCPIPKNSLA